MYVYVCSFPFTLLCALMFALLSVSRVTASERPLEAAAMSPSCQRTNSDTLLYINLIQTSPIYSVVCSDIAMDIAITYFAWYTQQMNTK